MAGATARVKSFTVTLALAVANNDCPTKAEALLPKLTRAAGQSRSYRSYDHRHGGSSGGVQRSNVAQDGIVSGRTASARTGGRGNKGRTGRGQEIRKRHAVRKLAAIGDGISETHLATHTNDQRNGVGRRHS